MSRIKWKMYLIQVDILTSNIIHEYIINYIKEKVSNTASICHNKGYDMCIYHEPYQRKGIQYRYTS